MVRARGERASEQVSEMIRDEEARRRGRAREGEGVGEGGEGRGRCCVRALQLQAVAAMAENKSPARGRKSRTGQIPANGQI